MPPSQSKRRKTENGSYSADVIYSALQLITEKGFSLRSAAREFHLSHKTLGRYLKKHKDGVPASELYAHYNSRQIFTGSQENDFAEYIKFRAKICYGMTSTDVKKAAFILAQSNNMKIPANWEKSEAAGEEWFRKFRKRHPDLSLKKPEPCSLSRCTSFNKTNIATFFEHLQKLVAQYPSFGTGMRIYNLDETGLTTVQIPQKVLAETSVRRLNKVTSAERGTLVTACCFICSNGTFLPPVLIFPRKKFLPIMVRGAPTGTLGLTNPSGWMNGDLFIDVMKHFIHHTNASKDNPALLIFDNHESHLTPMAISLARQNGVLILTIPPHCSNKMQPLDVSVYKSLKTAFHAATDSWLYSHPGQTVSIYDIADLFGVAFQRSMTPSNIQSGFSASGIFPFNKNIFTEEDFLTSFVTDRPKPPDETASLINPANTPAIVSPSELPMESEPGPVTPIEEPVCSLTPYSTASTTSSNLENSGKGISLESAQSSFVGAVSCLGLPKAGARKKPVQNQQRRRKSCIATSTPEMLEIEERFKKKVTKPQPKATKKTVAKKLTFPPAPPKKKMKLNLKKTSKINVLSDSDSSSDAESFQSGTSDSESFSSEGETEISVNDFCIVKFITEEDKKIKHFVGQVRAINKSGYDINFLRLQKKADLYYFTFPNVADQSNIDRKNIVKVVRPIQRSGTTARQNRALFFNFNVHEFVNFF